MATNIDGKAAELKAWIDGVLDDDGCVGEIDVRAQVRKRWPDLPPDIQNQIVEMAVALVAPAHS